ncbi:unnamed protein product [Boreogadus saida]
MSRKKLAWANKEVETFVCILGEEDVVYDVYVAAAAIDIRPTTKVEMRHNTSFCRRAAFSLMPHFHCRVRNGSDRKGIWYRFGYRNGAVTRMVPGRVRQATQKHGVDLKILLSCHVMEDLLHVFLKIKCEEQGILFFFISIRYPFQELLLFFWVHIPNCGLDHLPPEQTCILTQPGNSSHNVVKWPLFNGK